MFLFMSASLAFAVKWTYWASEPIQALDYKARAERILSSTPLIDGHNDLPFLFRLQLNNQIYGREFSFSQGRQSRFQTPQEYTSYSR